MATQTPVVDIPQNFPQTAEDVGAVPTTTTVNGHALSGNVTVTASDLGAEVTANKGAANGYAGLGADNYVVPAQLGPGSQLAGSRVAPADASAAGTQSADHFSAVRNMIAREMATITMTEAPYYASGDATTTKAAATTPVGTAVTVSDGSTFEVNHGIFIAGAGAGGADYIGTVVDVDGNDLTVDPATETEVTAPTTTTVGSTAAGVTVVVASATNAKQGRGITIAGAGAAGAAYHGYVASISGTTITLIAATITVVAEGAVVTFDNVMHDNTVAIQAAIDAANTLGGATLYFPSGLYRVNGPDSALYTSRRRILRLPTRSYYDGLSPITIEIVGPIAPSGPITNAIDLNGGGAVIQSDNTTETTALISGYGPSDGGFGPFTSVRLHLDKITFRSYLNPSLTMVDAKWVGALTAGDISVDVGVGHFGAIAKGTNVNSFAIISPYLSSTLPQNMHTVTIDGYNSGAVLTEHMHVDYLYCSFCTHAVGANAENGSVDIDHLVVDNCTNGVTGKGKINIGALTGLITTNIINDPTNLLYGNANVHLYSTGGPIGATNMVLRNVDDGTLWTSGRWYHEPRVIANAALDGATFTIGSVGAPLSSAKRYVIEVSVTASGSAHSLVELLPNNSNTDCNSTYLSITTHANPPLNQTAASKAYVAYTADNTVAWRARIEIEPRMNGASCIHSRVTYSVIGNGQIYDGHVFTTTDYTNLVLSFNESKTGNVKVTEYTE